MNGGHYSFSTFTTFEKLLFVILTKYSPAGKFSKLTSFRIMLLLRQWLDRAGRDLGHEPIEGVMLRRTVRKSIPYLGDQRGMPLV